MSNKCFLRYRAAEGCDCLIRRPRLLALPKRRPLHSHMHRTHIHAKTNTECIQRDTLRARKGDRQRGRKIWEAEQSASTSTEPPTLSVPTSISAHMACVWKWLHVFSGMCHHTARFQVEVHCNIIFAGLYLEEVRKCE